jgi:hypothetical protein
MLARSGLLNLLENHFNWWKTIIPVWGSSIPTQNTSTIPFQSTAVNPSNGRV